MSIDLTKLTGKYFVVKIDNASYLWYYINKLKSKYGVFLKKQEV